MPNRLIHETSPYLLQHANNPVDWYPWGPEALAKAREENKPIFLSIGYAACHWCHVMERESFENPETAALLNTSYVPIKVDREERPDLDSIYMNAVVAMTGQGGWPMSVFATPDGKPFYGGTYFPPVRRHGLPAFNDVLRGLAEGWRTRRDQLLEAGAKLAEAIGQAELPGSASAPAPLAPGLLDQAAERLYQEYDWTHGGWGGAPKFPQPMTLEFLLRRYTDTRDELALRMVTHTLDHMAQGGMYDQLGGGFHRYATDDRWLVPHFEKMLYDNAQLARVYLHAWQVTGAERYRRVTIEILDYVLREMTDPQGGFYSSQDADSEGHEGRYFVWTPAEIREALGEDAPPFMDRYGVTERGNFEGQNILFLARDPDVVAARHNLSAPAVEARLEAARRTLFERRETRVKPGRDDKVLAAWNGLMLAALAEAAPALKREDYRAAAEKNANFLLTALASPEGRLRRSWKDGEARVDGFLDDYCSLAEGLLALYQTTFTARWFAAARGLMDTVFAGFADPQGGFFDTSDAHETLVTRPSSWQDNAVPSGNAMAATVLLKLGAYTGEGRYTDAAERGLQRVQPLLGRAPAAFAQWLTALDFHLGAPQEIAIVGGGAEALALLEVVFAAYRPNQVVALGAPGGASPVPLLADRPQVDGRATAYVCRHFTCRQPVTEPEELAKELQR